MKAGNAERRRGRRVPVQAPLLLRTPEQPSPQEHTVSNVSLAGVYFETEELRSLALETQVLASITIPEHQRRAFPFTRLAGRGRIVRIDELPPQDDTPRRFGVALEFGKDLTALTAIPPWG